MAQTTEMDVLAELRDTWRAVIEGDGGHCPCCDRWGKVYRRNLNAAMARGLIWLTKQPDRGDGWVHVPSNAPAWMLRAQQLPTLHLWGLVEDFPKQTRLASSGLWRVTPLGIDFANNRTRVNKYVYVYNNTLLDKDGADISIIDALGDKYNYHEIMANFDGSDSVFGDDDGTDS